MLVATTTRRGRTLPLPQDFQRRLVAHGVHCAVHLIGKSQYVAAGVKGLFPPPDGRPPTPPDQIFSTFSFFPEEAHTPPTARQVRGALDFIEAVRRAGQRVLLDGAGQPWRAAVVAGCWIARQEGQKGVGDHHASSAEREAARLGWLRRAQEQETGASRNATDAAMILDAAQRAFVGAWPSGRDGQPALADLEWTQNDEAFPWASVDYWLRELPTVRLYPRGRLSGGVTVPVRAEAGQRHVVRHGADLRLTLDDLHEGTWVGERTLRLRDGVVIVFASP